VAQSPTRSYKLINFKSKLWKNVDGRQRSLCEVKDTDSRETQVIMPEQMTMPQRSVLIEFQASGLKASRLISRRKLISEGKKAVLIPPVESDSESEGAFAMDFDSDSPELESVTNHTEDNDSDVPELESVTDSTDDGCPRRMTGRYHITYLMIIL
jgi:hypothetical protein